MRVFKKQTDEYTGHSSKEKKLPQTRDVDVAKRRKRKQERTTIDLLLL